MCLLFVFVDIGRPDRFWHLLPPFGHLNFPTSLLAWDVLVLNLYFLVNFTVVTHIVYRAFTGRPYLKGLVVPLVLLSIPMAVGIHTVTAFLYSSNTCCDTPAPANHNDLRREKKVFRNPGSERKKGSSIS